MTCREINEDAREFTVDDEALRQIYGLEKNQGKRQRSVYNFHFKSQNDVDYRQSQVISQQQSNDRLGDKNHITFNIRSNLEL